MGIGARGTPKNAGVGIGMGTGVGTGTGIDEIGANAGAQKGEKRESPPRGPRAGMGIGIDECTGTSISILISARISGGTSEGNQGRDY